MRLVSSLALVLALIGMAPALPAEAQTWEIQVGGDLVDESIQTHAYYPRMITIHVGDTVQWRFAGVGAVTFDEFKPLVEHFVPGSEPGDLTAAPSWFPVGGATFDGSSVVSSGVTFPPLDEAPPYQLTFTRPGIFMYVDVIHPGTSGLVEVLPASAPLIETPADAKARGQGEYARVVASIRGEVQRFVPLAHTNPEGTTTHVISMGLSTGLGAGANRYSPSALRIRRGDTVVWTNGDDYAPHTVTFSSDEPLPPFLVPHPQRSAPAEHASAEREPTPLKAHAA